MALKMLGIYSNSLCAKLKVSTWSVNPQNFSGISLILLDIIMPEIDGFDVLQWMEQEKWLDDIPVILISSEDSANIINKGFVMGASDYIKRPFDYRIVYRRVYNIIKLYAKQKRLMDLLKKQVEKN